VRSGAASPAAISSISNRGPVYETTPRRYFKRPRRSNVRRFGA
jgi:hypothetical protein